MTFPEALRILSFRQEETIRLGLGRLRRSLQRLGDPHNDLACIHVAGTNGKGSTCAILESALRAAGYRTGLYLSPHLHCVRERIQVGGRPIAEKDFARALSETLAADPEGELTYFELLTCAAFLYFRKRRVKVVVLETGLGGRLDATNAVDRPLASVITSIDMDHAQILGGTLERIAGEKAGILKPGALAFCPELPAAAMQVVARRAAACRAPLHVVRPPWPVTAVDWRRNRQTLRQGSRRYPLSLLGSRQGRNAALARAVLDGLSEVLPVSDADWRRGLSRVRLPGRFQVLLLRGKTAIIDGAHNPEAIGELVRTLGASPWHKQRQLWIMALMRDKDRAAIIGRAAPGLREVVATEVSHPRALPAGDLAEALRTGAPGAVVREQADAAAALRGWLRDPACPRVAVICGSFYLAGMAAGILRGGRDV